MPSTVEQILASAGCRPAGVVSWGTPIRLAAPGIYLVSLDDGSDSVAAVLPAAPISIERVERWLWERSELALDGGRPSPPELVERLSRFWLPDEVILYAGLAGRRSARASGSTTRRRSAPARHTPAATG